MMVGQKVNRWTSWAKPTRLLLQICSYPMFEHSEPAVLVQHMQQSAEERFRVKFP